MLRVGYDVEYETTAIQTDDDPTLLREKCSVPRDQGWSWVVLFAAFLTLFVTNGVHASFGILYAALISHFKSGYEETAWIGSISLGLLCFFSPVASILIEHIGCRATSAIGGFLCSLGFLLSSFATGIALLYFTHGVLFGLGTSLTYTAAMLVVTRSFERKRNMATGLCTSGSQFGGISLAPLSQVLFDRLGYANTFRTFSGLLLVVAISSLAYKPDLVENRTLDSPAKKSPKEMLHVWKNKAYVVWTLATTMIALGYYVPRYTLVKYAIDQNISKDASAWLLSYLCLSSAIGRILFGRLCEWIPTLYLCQGCVLCCALAAFLIPFLKSYVALVIMCFMFGLPDGGFVASLPMLTTEIVGPERMPEGFGFMLFCQSYSFVVGPPLSGMLFDTYQSYIAVFCFAAVPEIIGALAMFLIPYYTRNQVNYRQEIGLNSNSGILVEDGINVPPSVSQTCEDPEMPTQETIGKYNVIINLPAGSVSPADIRQVNLIIQKMPGKGNCIESGSVTAEITSNITNVVENECDTIGYPNNTASNATIVASDSLSVNNVEYLQPSTDVNQDLVTCDINILNTEVAEYLNDKVCSTHKIPAETYLDVDGESGVLVADPNCKMPDLIVQDEILPTIPSTQLLAEIIVDLPSQLSSDIAEQSDGCLNNEIVDLMPELTQSNKSVPSLVNSPFAPVGKEELETIIQLTDDPPRLTPPPQPKGHSMRIVGEVVTNIDLTEQINEANHDTSVTSLIGSTPTTGFPSSLETFVQENLSCSHEIAFEVPTPSTPFGFNSDGIVHPNEPSLITSVAMNDTFSLVQDQLPEPLKPTSVCSVWGTAQAPCEGVEVAPTSNLDKASASSPLSCELSTVIADVIQSLTSQNTAKSNKESTAITDVAASISQSTDHVYQHESTEVEKNEANVEDLSLRGAKKSFGSTKTPFSQVSTRSVLDTMQSIVAEGCPEDSLLLEDISIDLSLDKDPSVASIVLIDENSTIQPENSSSCVKINSCYPGGEISQNNIVITGLFQQVETTIAIQDPILGVFLETLPASKQIVHPPAEPATDLIKSIESANPFYNNNVCQLTSIDTAERVDSIDYTNPFYSGNDVTPSSAVTTETISPMEATNPFYNNN